MDKKKVMLLGLVVVLTLVVLGFGIYKVPLPLEEYVTI